MHLVTYTAFKNELTKIAYHSVVDIAGLGALAAPTIQKMRGKEMSEKGTHAAELGGLGVLAGSSAHKIYSGAKKAFQAAPKSGVWSAIREGAKHASAQPQLVEGALSLFKKAEFDKEALFGLGAVAKAVPKAAFKPSFAGHAKALGVGTNVAKSGVETVKNFNPLTQSLSQRKSISIPGLT